MGHIPIDIQKIDSTRFWGLIKRGTPENCWPWIGPRDEHDYGNFYAPTRLRAHRVAFLLHYGSLNTKDCVLHECDSPPCCNPLHLHAGSQLKNIAERVARGRGAVLEQHGRARLTNSQVAIIKTIWRDGFSTQQQLADQFRVSISAIKHITCGNNWRSIL